MKQKIIITIGLVFFGLATANAQTSAQDSSGASASQEAAPRKAKKAWELGIGGTVFQFSRVGFSNFTQTPENYSFNLDLNHAVWGGGIYAARELNKHFYLDLQANLGGTNKSIEKSNRLLFMGGVGLQWRLGEYFHSKYVDPYLRAGVNYMYKGFSVIYTGSEGLTPDQMKWIMTNYGNKDGRDKHHMVPIALGGGINFWLNDRFGIGLQADYLIMPYKNVANSLQGSARLMWRIGGASKKTAPVIQYVDKVVEKIVEKQVIVEKPIEKIVTRTVVDLMNQVYFAFNSYELSDADVSLLDNIAETLKNDTSLRYLITGQTDSRGSAAYNAVLSEKRAKSVVDELIDRGVPAEMLKSRGVGKRIAIAEPNASNTVREGDRKTTIEVVTNMDYWDYLK